MQAGHAVFACRLAPALPILRFGWERNLRHRIAESGFVRASVRRRNRIPSRELVRRTLQHLSIRIEVGRLQSGQEVPKLVSLRCQITQVRRGRTDLKGEPFCDRQAVPFDGDQLTRIVA